MKISQNVALKTFNTLSLDAVAAYYLALTEAEQIPAALAFAAAEQLQVMVLSGGSNVLLPAHLNALVIHMNNLGIRCLEGDDTTQRIRVAAGENWHQWVLWSTAHGYYGLQNLALIPGRVGACPVQNIGAYGVEVAEFIDEVEVYDRQQHCFCTLSAAACQFAYRDSIFKHQAGRYIIHAVIFKLLKQPQLKLQYADLKQAMGDQLSPENLQQQVIAIRQRKLPDPAVYANVGSFFKNPVLSATQFEQIIAQHPNIPHYPQANEQYKIAAGWLIEQAGWKGKRLGAVGMFDRQALVLVNYAATQLEAVQQTYRCVQQDVFEKFAIHLEPEPVLFAVDGTVQPHVDRDL
ncbi:UDP-N-acetylmuramate dehydrogenase [Acinetobacter larvae]|uniref:UDP-N-acetylenolpyruvoylglucosamine reductase n=1 Tax=Acinetobacter larvae TaxID=1789224 RepID=A0A1B2LYH7_9GAMM|nr:UDP-N-acetylmuramate dehydrogenase [Acinetobacter larvae]AOA58008.1 UDP-N-acetylenolpyruvoylglucosamine reductase [Acinetobacter larvae]